MAKKNSFKTNFLSSYGKLRDEFKQYEPLAVISKILAYLYRDYEVASIKQIQKAPWVQILLIKWILTNPTFGKGKKIPTDKDVFKIMNMAWRLQNASSLPSEFPNLLLFMRSLAYQQFSFQQDFSFLDFSRQKLLFADLPEDHPFRSRFMLECGLEITDFMHLSMSIAARFLSDPKPVFYRSYFRSLENAYSSEKIDKFLRILSLEKKGT